MARTVRPNLTPLVDDAFNDLRPLWDQEKRDDFKHQSRVSPLQFKMAERLAKLPADDKDNLHYILVELSVRLNMKLATLKLRREVGLAFPHPHPGVFFSVYAELLDADEEHRAAIFAGTPKRVEPEEWTADKMKSAVRRFYKKADRVISEGIEKKAFVLSGLGRVVVINTGGKIEITLPRVLDVAIQKNAITTVLKVDLDDDDEDEEIAV
jgi:hypothetical protein